MLTRKLFINRRIVFAVIGDGVAIHFRVEPNWQKPNESWGEIEWHNTPAKGEKADNQSCWLLSGPCCHDGTSLYASEVYIPLFHQICEHGDGSYEEIWLRLEHDLKKRSERDA